MTIALFLIIVALSGFVGFKLGREIRGTTISGLKLAMVFWSAVIGLVLGAVASIVGLGLGTAFGIIAPGIGIGALLLVSTATGLGGGLAGCGLGHLTNR